MNKIVNLTQGSDEVEGEFHSELFGLKMAVTIYDAASVDYAERCIDYFNGLTEEILTSFYKACIRYCNDFLRLIGQEPRVLNSPSDILKSIKPGCLIVEAAEKSNEPIAHLELECDWDVEHGVEVVIRGNRVLYVGGFNGEDPWDDFKPKQSWNYA